MDTQKKTLGVLPFGLSRPRRPVVWIAVGLALLAGLKYGYDFGHQIGGVLLGVIAAFNAALFCSILVGSVVDRVFPDRNVDRTQE